MTFDEIVEAMSDAELSKKVAEHFKLKTEGEVEEITNGLVKKKSELLEEVKKLKDGKKNAEDLQKSYENIKNSLKTLNLEGVFSDNDSVDLIVLDERIKDISKRLQSAGQNLNVPEELAAIKREAEELKTGNLTYRKQLDKLEKEAALRLSEYEALTSEKSAADKALHQVMVEGEFKTLLVGRGLKPTQAAAMSRYLIDISGAKVYRDENGLYKAGCEDGTTSINAWLESFALTQEGKEILPEPELRGGGSNNGGSSGGKDPKKLTPDELAALSRSNPVEFKRVMIARSK